MRNGYSPPTDAVRGTCSIWDTGSCRPPPRRTWRLWSRQCMTAAGRFTRPLEPESYAHRWQRVTAATKCHRTIRVAAHLNDLYEYFMRSKIAHRPLTPVSARISRARDAYSHSYPQEMWTTKILRFFL